MFTDSHVKLLSRSFGSIPFQPEMSDATQAGWQIMFDVNLLKQSKAVVFTFIHATSLGLTQDATEMFL